MIQAVPISITTDASGDATAYSSPKLRGRIHALKYEYGTLAATADLTITGETTGVPILVKADNPQADAWIYPRAFPNQNTDGAAEADARCDIHILRERIKVVVAQGGNAANGTITAYVDTPDPY